MGAPTGVLFGVLRDIETFREQFGATHCVFAFDSPSSVSLRRGLDPEYKGNRRKKERTDEEMDDWIVFKEQVVALRKRHLPTMGYRNIFWVRGYEADDIIAWYAEDGRIESEIVIISSDKDLYQCLREGVVQYRPIVKEVVDRASFYREWQIDPIQWPSVKSLAGDVGDNVIGIRGIGEKTAAQWMRGVLKSGTKKHQDILDNLDIHNRNLPLVQLPFPGLEDFLPDELEEDEVTEEGRQQVMDELGIKSKGRRVG